MSVSRSSQVGAIKMAEETKKNRKWLIIKAVTGISTAVAAIIGLILRFM